jgi:DNA polymerase I-like protein with 3'-5' exonuclease and polymerase domains
MKPGKYKTSFLGTEVPVLYVTDKTEAERLLKQLMSQPLETYALDTETAALPKYKKIGEAALSPHLSAVRLLQLFTGRTAIVFDIGKIETTGIFKSFLEEKRFVGHNSLFDLQYLYKQFGASHIDIGCSYLAAKLIFHATTPTDAGLSASLRSLVNALFKTEILKEMQVSDWSVPELTWEQIEYSALDAVTTYRLAEKLAPKISKFGLERIYQLYKDAQHPLAKMQLNGIKLDTDKHRDLIVDWRSKLYTARKELTEITKLDTITPTTLAKYLEKSLPKETLAIWPRTDTGKLQTDSHVFAEFDYLPIVKPFAEFQKREKLCTSFGNSLIEQINPETGRLHARYRLAGARTGRLSCSDPNLQQLPRENLVRQNFIPEKGNIFVCADYSQVELRVAAEVSRDETMLRAYKQGIDLHKLTASLISKKRIQDVTKEDRQKAKAFNFGLLFGLGAKKFSHYAKKSYGAEVSQEEANAGVKAFRETYYGYREWQLDQSSNALERGFCTTPCGKRRCLDRDNSYGPSMNTPIQGGAAECMLYALVRLNNLFTTNKVNAKITNCIHDELLVECEPKDKEQVSSWVEGAMESGFLDVFPKGIVRGICECKSGNSWGAAKA